MSDWHEQLGQLAGRYRPRDSGPGANVPCSNVQVDSRSQRENNSRTAIVTSDVDTSDNARSSKVELATRPGRQTSFSNQPDSQGTPKLPTKNKDRTTIAGFARIAYDLTDDTGFVELEQRALELADADSEFTGANVIPPRRVEHIAPILRFLFSWVFHDNQGVADKEVHAVHDVIRRLQKAYAH